MKLSIVAGATSESVNIFIQDSSSTTGAGLTGLVFNSSGLTAYYTFTGTNAAATAITLATLAAVNSAYSSGGFKEIDATNMPGWYRFDIPNAALAASKGRSVGIHLKGATNMAPLPIEIELTGWNNQDAVHGGMSALPNTAVTTNASLLTSGTGTDQISVDGAGNAAANVKKWNGSAVVAPNVAGVPIVDVKYTLGTLSTGAAGYVGIDWGQITNKATANALSGTTVSDLSTGTAAADALLARNVAGGSSTGRLVKEAFYFLRNKFTTVGGTLTVYQTDDSTISWTATLTTDNTAQPIVTSDPA